MAILTFYFKLVHVPGVIHGPDGLSRHPIQPDDPPIPSVIDCKNDEFADWVNLLHGFMHMVQRIGVIYNEGRTLAIQKYQLSLDDLKEVTDYTEVIQSEAAEREEVRLSHVQGFIETLERPRGMTDDEFCKFSRYILNFVIKDDCLWRRDPQGSHKLVV